MYNEKYPLRADESLMVFEFVSEGPNGIIPKIVKFSQTNLKSLYNLGFGDKEKLTGNLNDLAISNNGDSEKVLITVVAAVYAFTDKYPETMIYATGSTRSRTRLYRMGLTKYFNDVDKDFHVYGLKNNEWEFFEKGIVYEAFLAKRKNVNFTI